ncbi:fimbrial protein [Enterobacter sp. 638]|uniref:Fimbrial protein n=1 Tax=Enterobacter sp. (strain 638) TaxID=399742 RepID=A0A9J9GHT1_ENT38|nr:fimbrial protein [Enterobacter sp. 638]ABP61117.1 Fimbrial protein [Enterobacter sp. 638]
MNLRKNVIAATMLAIISGSACAAETNAGTIHFTGQIIEPSCTIKGDDGTDSTVPLGTYPTSLFTASGDESTLVPFSITLVDCPVKSDGLPQVQLTFTGPTTLTGATTLLDVSKITTTGDTAATGVGIAISAKGEDDQLLSLDGKEGQIYIDLPEAKEDQIKSDFNARYKSFAAKVTAGPADGDLTVNILYR